MGWRFGLKYANTVAYITQPERTGPPRVTSGELREFLGSLEGEYRDQPPLISSDRHWIEEVARVARQAAQFLESWHLDDSALVDPDLTIQVLSDLRRLLGNYDLFGMPIGAREDRERLYAFAEHAAYSSKQYGLFLIPDLPHSADTIEILDPLPVVRSIATRPDMWPGVLFWLRTGVSTFATLDDAYGLYQRILEGFRGGMACVERIIYEFNLRNRESGSKRLLHLSDLHFGTTKALENQTYLSAHLKSRIDSVDRIVVTGDLFDNPKREDALAFKNFRAELESASGRDIIVIPGNHDQRLFGNTMFGFGQKLRELADLEWSSLVVDDRMQCVFYCFDSSKGAGDFARGRVTAEQMMEVATLFETKAVAKPELRRYLSIALIHHHPYSFKAKAETRVQKVLAAIGLSEERFLRMDDADRFLSWCVGRHVPLILHGHKHLPRHITERIEWTHGKDREWRDVTAVGCGTSLGIEGMPLSYNILEWSPSTQRWTASFYADPGFGTGFEEQLIALHSVEA